MAEAVKILQDRYDTLASLYNHNRIAEIGQLYGSLAVIRARKTKRIFKKRKGAVAFWAWLKAKKKVQNIRFKIVKAALLTAPELAKVGPNLYKGTVQRVSYIGRISYNPKCDFGGDGDHLDICAFLGRNEDYEF